MKRAAAGAALLLTLLLTLLPCAAAPSAAAPPVGTEEKAADEQEPDYWAAFNAALPERLGEYAGEAESAEELTGAEHLFAALQKGVCREGGEVLKTFACLLGITVLGTVATLLCGAETGGEGLKKPLGTVVTVACALAVYTALAGCLQRTEEYLSDLMRFSEGVAPVLGGILISGGATGAGAATSASFATILLGVEKICVGVLTPLAGACFAFAMIGGLSPDLKLDGISKTVRGIYLTLLGTVCTVAGAASSMQTLLAASADSVAMRTARYAVGNMIPIVGGTIGASLGTLGASLTFVKNSVGVSAIAVILLLTLPTVIHLYLTRLSVSLCGAFARLTGFRAGEEMLKDFRGVFDMILAVTAFVSVTFILYLTVFLRTALPAAGV